MLSAHIKVGNNYQTGYKSNAQLAGVILAGDEIWVTPPEGNMAPITVTCNYQKTQYEDQSVKMTAQPISITVNS